MLYFTASDQTTPLTRFILRGRLSQSLPRSHYHLILPYTEQFELSSHISYSLSRQSANEYYLYQDTQVA